MHRSKMPERHAYRCMVHLTSIHLFSTSATAYYSLQVLQKSWIRNYLSSFETGRVALYLQYQECWHHYIEKIPAYNSHLPFYSLTTCTLCITFMLIVQIKKKPLVVEIWDMLPPAPKCLHLFHKLEWLLAKVLSNTNRYTSHSLHPDHGLCNIPFEQWDAL